MPIFVKTLELWQAAAELDGDMMVEAFTRSRLLGKGSGDCWNLKDGRLVPTAVCQFCGGGAATAVRVLREGRDELDPAAAAIHILPICDTCRLMRDELDRLTPEQQMRVVRKLRDENQ